MAVEFKFPDIGEGVMEGEVTKWLVKEGDYVKRDQPLVEVMTEKVTVELPSPVAGTVLKIMARAGETIRVGQTLIVLGEKGETVQIQNVASESITMTSTAHSDLQKTAQPVLQGKIIATPAIRKLARELNVDLAVVQATGPGARITEEDVKNASKRAEPMMQGEGLEERIPLKGIRKTIAERMARSKHIAAHVTHVEEVDFTELISAKEKAKMAQKSNVKITYLPFIVKAVINGLKRHPHLNASLDDQKNEIVVKKYYNVGIAVATENGLIVPVIKDADKKNLVQIAQEIEELSDKARTGRLALNETRGGTFTITNIGSIGGVFSTAIINHPEVAILAIGRIVKRPVVKNGTVVVRDMVNFSLNFDHRVLDGADAASFLNVVKQKLEEPNFDF
ncbi:MAG: 2-oxo acid dehydrogenase subunit E2 [Thaumarchaeota archaeon]|nr:2-oxo acid dehydrogenase subunit E2 [Nitrososphaerota archaeon]